MFSSFWEVNRPRASHSLLSPSDRLVFSYVTSNKKIYIFMFVQIIRQFPFMCKYLLSFICVHSSRLARLLQNSAIHRSKAVCYSVSGPTILHPPFLGGHVEVCAFWHRFTVKYILNIKEILQHIKLLDQKPYLFTNPDCITVSCIGVEEHFEGKRPQLLESLSGS